MEEAAKFLIVTGLAVCALGAILFILAYAFPGLGHLPGDISIVRPQFRFYFPLTTCLIVSAILSLIFWFFSKR